MKKQSEDKNSSYVKVNEVKWITSQLQSYSSTVTAQPDTTPDLMRLDVVLRHFKSQGQGYRFPFINVVFPNSYGPCPARVY